MRATRPHAASWCGTLLAAALGAAGPVHAQLAPAPPAGGQSTISSPAVGLAPPPATVKGRYLDAVPSVVRGDGGLLLVVDLVPKPGMRVYAPGNKGYTAVQLSVDPVAGRTFAPTKYPKPDTYLFAPLNERVLVFASPFRLSRAVSTAAGPARGPVTGRVEYQACDDKVCYLPQTLSVSWNLTP